MPLSAPQSAAQSASHPAAQPRYHIHPYPAALIDTRSSGAAGRLTLRPVLPQDDVLLAALVEGLSPAARRNRFHGAVKLSPIWLQQMSCVDYRQQLALVVTAQVAGAEQVVADARYVVEADGQGAEFALMVAEPWQHHGVGTWALRALQRAATQAGLRWLNGEVLEDNAPMLGLMRRSGFALCPHPEDERLVRVQQCLGTSVASTPRARHGVLRWLARALPGRAQIATA